MTAHTERRRLSRRVTGTYFKYLAPNEKIEMVVLGAILAVIWFLGWLF